MVAKFQYGPLTYYARDYGRKLVIVRETKRQNRDGTFTPIRKTVTGPSVRLVRSAKEALVRAYNAA